MIALTHRPRAFSLLEMLVVIGIIAIMMSLLIPAVGGFSSTAGRRGAVNIVMNTLEQARVAALESGQTVYVGFADNDFPVEDMRNSAFVVFRDASDEEKIADPGKNYVILKNWTRLPKHVFFRPVNGTLFATTGGTTFNTLNNSLPPRYNDNTLPSVGFNSSGAVESAAAQKLWLYIEDRSTKAVGTLFEQISIARYTGRVQLDITATGS